MKGKTYTAPEQENKNITKQTPINLGVFGIPAIQSQSNVFNDPGLTVLTDEAIENDIHAPQPAPVEALEETETPTESEETIPKRVFPSGDDIFHFHPIAFVNHMKLIYGSGATGECFCNKDFTAEDLKKIVQYVRFNTFDKDSKGKRRSISFFHKNGVLFNGAGGVPKEDRTYEKLAKVLNTSFAKFGITNCSHKIHYLANMYVETNYFTATEEFGNNHSYMPYKGRGFQHVTDWNHGKAKTQEIREKTSNYKAYSDAEGNQDIYTGTNYLKVASDIELAADTAGWFWKRANINAEAEKDDIFGTAKKINNPSAKSSSAINGFKMRRAAWIKFKEVFNNYPYNCVTDASKHEAPLYGEGVLEEMREWADQHIQYKQESENTGTNFRSGQSEDALGRMDCSELVCRYLHKLGVTDKVRVVTTISMKKEETFWSLLGNKNVELVAGSDKSDFIPQAGDFFVWHNGDGGHTGIVHSYDASKDAVTILEAIGSYGAASESEKYNRNNGGYEGYHCTRTSIYERKGSALSTHSGWIGYYRPKNYTKQL